MTLVDDTPLPAKDRLAAIDRVTELLQDVDAGPIELATDPADDVDEAYWKIVLTCVKAVGDRTTSLRHARGAVEVAAYGYRAIVEIRNAMRRAEAELAAIGHRATAEEPIPDGG